MPVVEPNGGGLGATIRDLDLSKPLDGATFRKVIVALGRYGVLRFPGQTLSPARQAALGATFGDIHASAKFRIPGTPEISMVSNIVENGVNIGYVDAGMIWHKDMTAHRPAGFATILHAVKVPRRDGKALGDTEFVDVQAATDDLPAEIKARLKNAVGIHSSENYNATVRAEGSKRPAFEQLTVRNPPVSHPLLLTHPVTGKTVLYCDPGHVMRIEGLPDGVDGEALLKFLADHQLQPKFRYAHSWTEGDALMWDNLGTLHRGTLDYRADEPRLMNRCLIKGNKVFDPSFIGPILAGA